MLRYKKHTGRIVSLLLTMVMILTMMPASAVTGDDGKLASLPTPARTGYTFDGWFTGASGGTKLAADSVYTSDTTIYAHWTAAGGNGNNGNNNGDNGNNGGNNDSNDSDSGSGTYVDSLPKDYQGGTKVIDNVRVPDYVVEGSWKADAEGRWRLSGADGKDYAGGWVPAYSPYADPQSGQLKYDRFIFDENGVWIA